MTLHGYALDVVRAHVKRHGSIDAVCDAFEATVTEAEWGNCRAPERRSRILEINRNQLRHDYATGEDVCGSAMPATVWQRI